MIKKPAIEQHNCGNLKLILPRGFNINLLLSIKHILITLNAQ